MASTLGKAVLTVVGKDTVGIIAKICTFLSDHEINILDISQTIVSDYFNMIMIIDLSKTTTSFEHVQDGLAEIGEGLGVDIKCQREEIFEMMHRI